MAEKKRLYVLCENQREVDACIDYKIQNNHKWASGNPVSAATDSGYKSGYVINMADGGNTTIYDKAIKKAEVIKFTDSKFANWWPQVRSKEGVTCTNPKVDYEIKDSYSKTCVLDNGDNYKTATSQNSNSKTTNNMKNSIKTTAMNTIFNSMIPTTLAFNEAIMTMTGGVAYLRKDGTYARYDAATGQILVQPFDGVKEIGEYCFAMPIPVGQLQVGDTIKHNGCVKVVTGVKGGKIQTINITSGTGSFVTPEAIEGFGISNVFKIQTMFDMNGGQAFGGMNPMMFMLMDKEGENGGNGIDMKSLMMMQMMGGMNGQPQAGGMNPMMIMALAGKDSSIDPMTMMMMSGMGGNIFGQQPAIAAPVIEDVIPNTEVAELKTTVNALADAMATFIKSQTPTAEAGK